MTAKKKGANKMQSDPVKDMLGAIGALGEMAGQYMTSFENNGFSREEALRLTSDILVGTMRNANGQRG